MIHWNYIESWMCLVSFVSSLVNSRGFESQVITQKVKISRIKLAQWRFLGDVERDLEKTMNASSLFQVSLRYPNSPQHPIAITLMAISTMKNTEMHKSKNSRMWHLGKELKWLCRSSHGITLFLKPIFKFRCGNGLKPSLETCMTRLILPCATEDVG